MSATIKIKNSSTAGAAPTSSDLVQGELAVNVTDKRLFTENASGTVVELGTNPSVPVTFPDGSASAPSLTNSGDTNTGMFFPAADTIAFAEGGTETMRLDSAGNMGLGVTPSTWGASYKVNQVLNAGFIGYANRAYVSANWYDNGSGDKYIASDYATRYIQLNGQHRWDNASSGTAGNAISFTQAMTLDASGNLLVGTTSSSYSAANRTVLALGSGSTGSLIDFQVSGSTSDGYIYFDGTNATVENSNAGYVRFSTNAAERVRIDSSGNLLVGTTNSSNTAGTGLKFSANGLAASVLANSGTASDTWNVYNTTAGAFRFYVTNGGTIFATSTTISAISDERLKENVRDLEFGLSEVMALKPRRFDWKEGKGQDKKNAAGFIAQEFETVFPASVGLSKAGEDGVEYKNINHEELIPTLVKAIQELKAEVDALKGTK